MWTFKFNVEVYIKNNVDTYIKNSDGFHKFSTDYFGAKVDRVVKKSINHIFDDGHKVVLYTFRQNIDLNDEWEKRNWLSKTENFLVSSDIKYSELKYGNIPMGRPTPIGSKNFAKRIERDAYFYKIVEKYSN